MILILQWVTLIKIYHSSYFKLEIVDSAEVESYFLKQTNVCLTLLTATVVADQCPQNDR